MLHDPQQLRGQVGARHHHRTRKRPKPFSRPLRTARGSQTARRGPRRHLLHLRAGRHQGGRRQGLRRRVEARLFCLGVQGQTEKPARRLRSARALRGRPREPAAPGGLRPLSLRGPHQLHRHPQAGPPLYRPRPARPQNPPAPQLGLYRPRAAEPQISPRKRHPRGEPAGRRTGRQAEPARSRPRDRGALYDAARLCVFCRGRGAAARQTGHPHLGAHRRDPGAGAALHLRAVSGDGDGRRGAARGRALL
jgi:hypothetical protein